MKLPIRCHTCSTVLSLKKVYEILDVDNYNHELVIKNIRRIIPISYCCNIKFINYLNDHR